MKAPGHANHPSPFISVSGVVFMGGPTESSLEMLVCTTSLHCITDTRFESILQGVTNFAAVLRRKLPTGNTRERNVEISMLCPEVIVTIATSPSKIKGIIALFTQAYHAETRIKPKHCAF